MSQDWAEIIPIVDGLTDDIIEECFKRDEIDTDKFWTNYECLLRRCESALIVSYEGIENEKVTPSLSELLKLQKIGSMPLWFVSAYPDVVKWSLDNEEKKTSVILSYRQLIDGYLEISKRTLECR